jgi:hypothetical protein
MAIPYTGLFIAPSCNSRSSHGQYTRSSTEHVQYGAITSARLLGQNYKNRNYSKVRNYVLYIHSFFQPNNGSLRFLIAHALNTSKCPIDSPHESHGQASVKQGVAISTHDAPQALSCDSRSVQAVRMLLPTHL